MKIQKFVAFLAPLVFCSVTYADLFRLGSVSWKEEVLLDDGRTILVTRTVERGGRHEIGQEPPIREQKLSFNMPGTNESVAWHDKPTDDIRSANFLPMLLEVRKDTAYLVAYPMGCLSYNKWGRPNPPYVAFQLQGNTWRRIRLAELPSEIKTPNLIFSSPDHEAQKMGKSVILASTIRALYESYRQTEFKTILREAVPGASGGCAEMVSNGKGHWLGLDWFKGQPSLDACLKLCARKEFDAQHCPCDSVFRSK